MPPHYDISVETPPSRGQPNGVTDRMKGLVTYSKQRTFVVSCTGCTSNDHISVLISEVKYD